MTNRLYRSRDNKMVAGVCGGLGEYFDVDVTLIRLITFVAAFLGGAGVIFYLVGLIIIPKNPYHELGLKGMAYSNSQYDPYESSAAKAEQKKTAESVKGEEAVKGNEAPVYGTPLNIDPMESVDAEIVGEPQTSGVQEETAQAHRVEIKEDSTQSTFGGTEESINPEQHEKERRRNNDSTVLLGAVLVVLGTIYLFDVSHMVWDALGTLWPLIPIAIGARMILKKS